MDRPGEPESASVVLPGPLRRARLRNRLGATARRTRPCSRRRPRSCFLVTLRLGARPPLLSLVVRRRRTSRVPVDVTPVFAAYFARNRGPVPGDPDVRQPPDYAVSA